jgi:GNAT superfamily N-acetyltransferase
VGNLALRRRCVGTRNVALSAPKPGFIIRDMRPEDKDAVVAYAQDTWEWGDYLPRVLDQWLLDQRSTVRLAATDLDEPIGSYRLTRVDEHQGWLSGLRVRADERGRGAAGLLLEDALALARHDGLRIVRYASEITNEAVYSLSRAGGFSPRGTWLTFERVMDSATCALGRNRNALGEAAPLGDTDKPRILSLLRSSGHNLYVGEWMWRALDDAALGALVEQGRAFLARSGVGGWSVAVVGSRDEQRIEVTLHGADSACTQSLMEFLKRMACDSPEGVTLMLHVQQNDPAANLLASLARRGEWRTVMEQPLRIWELQLN